MSKNNQDKNLAHVNTLLQSTENDDLGENPLITLFEKTIELPKVKVNRTAFLMETYNLSGTDIESKESIELFSKISLEQMDKAASSVIAKNVTVSSTTAFALGLPGGYAMALSIPADIMQTFAY